MTYFIRNGSTFTVTDDRNMDLHNKLPVGNYVVKFSPMIGFFLDQVDDFTLPKKIYGDITRYQDRIISTFLNRDNSTGVLLEGEKGSGKTLLAKALAVRLAKEHKMPTLILNNAYAGDAFNAFIQTIDQPLMMLFDEFEKVYRGDWDDPDSDLLSAAQDSANGNGSQGNLLTLFDGVFPTKKLFVLTVNNKFAVNSHLKNRPGRLYYMITFTGLEENFIVEYCEENLKPELTKHIPKVLAASKTVDRFNFDMLKALVEEMNRYDEAPKQAISMLNINPDFNFRVVWTTKFIDAEGNEIPVTELDTKQWAGDPRQEFYIDAVRMKGKKIIGTYEFTAEDIQHVDMETESVVLKNKKGESLILQKRQSKRYDQYFDYDGLL